MAQIKITLVRSLVGRNKKHILTAHSLGLRKPGDSTVQEDIPQTTGKVQQIRYMLRVDQLDGR